MKTKGFVFVVLLASSIVHASKMVLVGGGLQDDNSVIYSSIIELASKDKRDAFLGIITAASETAVESGKFYVDQFKKFGAGRVEWIPLDINHTENNRSPKILQQIRDMNGFFFGGMCLKFGEFITIKKEGINFD